VPLAVLDAVGLDIVVPQLRGRANAVRSVLRVAMTAAAPAVFGFLSESYGLRSAIIYAVAGDVLRRPADAAGRQLVPGRQGVRPGPRPTASTSWSHPSEAVDARQLLVAAPAQAANSLP